MIGGDYSKLGVDSLLFFQVGEWGIGIFSIFVFYVQRMLPQLSRPATTPSPPSEKSPSYPQASVDSVDNFYKSLIPLDIL